MRIKEKAKIAKTKREQNKRNNTSCVGGNSRYINHISNNKYICGNRRKWIDSKG